MMHFQRNVTFVTFWVAAFLVSITFGSALAVNSGSVRRKFLPQEYSIFSSKESARCNDYVLIEDGKMSLCLDKARGTRTIMLSGKELDLTFDTFWQFISDPDSRFEKVPRLFKLCPFKIYGLLKAKFLSPDTRYSAYIVYKAKDQIPDVQKSFGVGVILHETLEGKKFERLQLTKIEKRADGWVEAKFGEFLNDGGFMDDHNEIWFSIDEIKYSYWTPGLIIQGIEFRPVKKVW
ncbi:unnamed protein product [Eruca vesicaria subsp. sativa]|uniref:Uncharacterized protein n=1 Tax=Eruca vesicaria subsp. sativa TaxID=29727 RepID=A0ABC8K8Q8_ERUVS|nr:unnamed protein product [Eruca vesicaria subsp. sativa]